MTTERAARDIDTVDMLLGVMGAFDWITPTLGWLSGYNQGIQVATHRDAVQAKDALAEQGIRAKIEGDIFSGYRVMWRA